MPVDNIDVKDALGTTRNVRTIPANGQQTSANSRSVALSTEQQVILSSVDSALSTRQALGFYPAFTPPPAAGTERGLSYDEFGSLFVRGGATTDEGSVRVGYADASLTRSIGTITLTNGSAQVTGAGFLSLEPQPLVGDYIKLSADAESAYARIYSIDSNTAMTLDGNYSGAGGTGASLISSMKPMTTGTGATIAVAGGNATISCNTTAAQTIALTREVDYGPLVWQSNFSVSQRIANQTIYRGFINTSLTRRYLAAFLIDGTTNTTVICQTGWAFTAPAATTDLQSTTVTLPNGATTATAQDYRIELRGEVVSFYIADVPVATHSLVIPRPYDVMAMGTLILNGTTPATNTDVVIGYDLCNNLDSLRISIANNTDVMLAAQPPAKLFSYSVAGVIPINTDLLVIDCAQFRSLSIQCASMGTTGVVTVAWCNEPTFTVAVTASLNDQTGNISTTFNGAGLRVANVLARYCRLRLTTATTAGTTTINVQGFQIPMAPIVGNMSQMNGVGVTMNNGTAGNGVQRVAIASDNTANSNPWLVTLVPSAAQGASTIHHLISAASTNATSVKASAGTISSGCVSNLNAAARYFKLYNKASAPTVGTDTPVLTLYLRPTANEPIPTGTGFRLSTGIAYALTTGIAVSDTGAVAASEHSVNIVYT